jgi:uncharacterized protein YndB with AHSA1/START domain
VVSLAPLEELMISDIVYEATYPYPPEQVWKAIATPEGLSAWLMQNDFREAKVGHKFRFTDRPRPFWDGICDCEVAVADSPRLFALKWGVNVKSTTTDVSWTLAPTSDGGTHVQFRHGGLTGLMGFVMKKGMSKGWRLMLERSIPFVLEKAAQGALPPRDEVKRVMRQGNAARS